MVRGRDVCVGSWRGGPVFRAALVVAGILGGLMVFVGAEGCGGTLGVSCINNSDCNETPDTPLCVLGRCTIFCKTDIDCIEFGDRVCITDPQPEYGGRKTGCVETIVCNTPADCGDTSAFTCFEGKCRSTCTPEIKPCPEMQRCQVGACVADADTSEQKQDELATDPTWCLIPDGGECGAHSHCKSNLCGQNSKCVSCEPNSNDCGAWTCLNGTCVNPATLAWQSEKCPPYPADNSKTSSSSSSSGSSGSGTGGGASSSSSSSSSGTGGGILSDPCDECIDSQLATSAYNLPEACLDAHLKCLNDTGKCADISAYANGNCPFGIPDKPAECCVQEFIDLNPLIEPSALDLFFTLEQCVYCTACKSKCGTNGDAYCAFVTAKTPPFCP